MHTFPSKIPINPPSAYSLTPKIPLPHPQQRGIISLFITIPKHRYQTIYRKSVVSSTQSQRSDGRRYRPKGHELSVFALDDLVFYDFSHSIAAF
jgi:hypothetical protein